MAFSRCACFIAAFATMAATNAGAESPAPSPSCGDIQLIVYGLVVGLRGTGDTLARAPMTMQSLKAILARNGDQAFDPERFDRTVAAAMVTAKVRRCFANGVQTVEARQALDLKVSAMGDARSLEHGALLPAPLMGEDGRIYALGEGAIEKCPGQSDDDWRTIPTSACIIGGGIVRP